MTAQKHIHKLKMHKYKTGNTVYFCALPDCAIKLNPALALGKRTICWRCDEPFIMNEYSIRLVKPHCEKCHKPKEQIIKQGESPGIPEIAIEDLRNIAFNPFGEVIKAIPAVVNDLSNLRSRLSGLQGKPDEEDI